MTRKLSSYVRIVAVSVSAFMLGSATIAVGLVANGVIDACYNNATGILRVATAKAPCILAGSPLALRSPFLIETAISWNQVGAQGAKGDTGDVGPQGVGGPTGPQGPAGAQGSQGVEGPMGPTGPQGAAGSNGTAGATGAQGPKGDAGATGATGPAGTVNGVDALTGTPCQIPPATPGTLSVSYETGGKVALTCVPSLPVTLTVTRSGTGSGTVSSGTALICGTHCTTKSYPPGTSVTLTAAPDAFSTFTGWTGGCTGSTPTCTLTVISNVTVDAAFGAKPGLALELRAPYQCPSGIAGLCLWSGGTVNGGTIDGVNVTALVLGGSCENPAGNPCPLGGVTYAHFALPPGTTLTLTATHSAPGRPFIWGGACSGSTTTCVVTIGSDRTLVSIAFFN